MSESLGSAAALPRALRRLYTALPPRTSLVLAALFVALLEVLGRCSTSDWLDAALAVALFDGTLMFAARWRSGPRLVERLRVRVARLGRHLRTPHGLDLRATPRLELGLPRAPLLALGATLAFLGFLLLERERFPGRAREALRGVSGFLSLVFLGLLWSALAALGVGLWSAFLDHLRRRTKAGNSAFALAFGLLSIVLGCAARAPASWGLAFVTVAWALPSAILLAFAADVPLAWRTPDRGLRRGHLGLWEAATLTGFTGLALVPILLAVGDRLEGTGLAATNGTAWLGRFVLWSFGLGLALFGWTMIGPLVPARLADPRRPRRPLLRLHGPGDRRTARALATRAGYRCVERAPRRDVAVPLRVLPAGTGRSGTQTWSGTATLEDLERPEFLARLARRHEVQSRRALKKGLAKALTRLRAQRHERGSGFWIAPHLWIATHPARDTEEPGQRQHGLPWRRLLPLAARHSLADTLAALDLDLLFVEDGVRPRAFRRVVELLFEHHDLFGQRRCEDTRHFAGLPGVRVVLHEVGLDAPPRTEARDYPEPDYEEIGRARILHVFRDRGGERDRVPVPTDRGHRPVAPRLVPSL